MNSELNGYYRKIRTVLEIAAKTIHEELVTALGPSALSYTTVARWEKRFREEGKDVNDYPLSATPRSEFTGENAQLV